MRWAALLLGFCTLAWAQSKLDLAYQGQNVDFSSAASTKPFRMGVELPTTCLTGQTFFKTNAPAGMNVYACTSTDVWTLQGDGGGSGAVLAGDLLDCKVTTNGAVATVKAPCNVSIGGTVFGIITDATATLSGSSGSGIAYFYWNSSGRLVADENTAATLSCNTNCSTATTGTFPYDALPVATATFTANSFDGGGVTDKRAWLNQKVIVAGSGISTNIDGGTGVQTISTDPQEVPRFFTGTSNPPTQNCTAGRDFYANPTVSKQWGCTATNSWTELTAPLALADPGGNGFLERTALNVTAARTLTGTAGEVAVANGGGGGDPTISIADTFRITGKTATAPVKTGTSLPGTCTVGDLFYKSDAAAGQNLYGCTATDTWTLQGGGGGSLLPDQTNARGMYLTSDGSTAAWARSIDKTRWIVQMRENFIRRGQTFGQLDWTATPYAGSDAASTWQHPGAKYVYGNSSANSAANLRLDNSPSDNKGLLGALGSNAKWESYFTFGVGPYPSTSQVAYRAGFVKTDQAAQNAPTDWIGIRYWNSAGCANNATDTYWTYETRAGGASTTTPTAVGALSADQWLTLRVRSVTPGTVLFSISTDGGATFSSETSHSTNVTTNDLMVPFFQSVACGTSAIRMYVDEWSYEAWR